jgi:hypothetical protein
MGPLFCLKMGSLVEWKESEWVVDEKLGKKMTGGFLNWKGDKK